MAIQLILGIKQVLKILEKNYWTIFYSPLLNALLQQPCFNSILVNPRLVKWLGTVNEKKWNEDKKSNLVI